MSAAERHAENALAAIVQLLELLPAPETLPPDHRAPGGWIFIQKKDPLFERFNELICDMNMAANRLGFESVVIEHFATSGPKKGGRGCFVRVEPWKRQIRALRRAIQRELSTVSDDQDAAEKVDVELTTTQINQRKSEQNKSEQTERKHTDCFASVSWDGSIYTFTTAQRAVVEKLWQAMESNTLRFQIRRCSQRQAVTARTFEMFRSNGKHHPAWSTMIVRVGRNARQLSPRKT
ncbi:MAG: hypothetical protein WKF77_06155 [Planctomycetaceae bacterium]